MCPQKRVQQREHSSSAGCPNLQRNAWRDITLSSMMPQSTAVYKLVRQFSLSAEAVRVDDISCSLLTRGPNGPDIAHLGILPQFGQNPFRGY